MKAISQLTWFRIGALVLVASLLLPGGLPARAQPAAAPRPRVAPRPAHIRESSNWFRLRHMGTQPAPLGALQQAQAQAAALPLAAGTASWLPLGPQPADSTPAGSAYGLISGRITALAVSGNPLDVWAAAAAGGVWHSTDGGSTWQSTFDSQPVLSMGALVIDPNDANTVYAGTGEANLNLDGYWGVGLFKTTDAGTSWQNLAGPAAKHLTTARIAVSPASSQTLLMAVGGNPTDALDTGALTRAGIWRSTDAGATWKMTLHDPNGQILDAGTDVAFDPSNANLAYAGLGNVYADGDSLRSGVYRSTDGGVTWQVTGNGIPVGSDVRRVTLGVAADGSRLYAVLTDGDWRDEPNQVHNGELLNGAVYVSTDHGLTWTAMPVPANMAVDESISQPGRQWWYNALAAVDPANPLVAYAGGIDLWQTTDGGTTWTNLTQVYTAGKVHPDQHALIFAPGLVPGVTTTPFYLGDDGGVWVGDGQGNYTNRNAGGLNITQFWSGAVGNVGPQAMLYGGAQDNGEIRYPLGQFTATQQWDEVYGGDGGVTAVDESNNAVVYEEYTNGQMSKSTDGGATWTSIFTPTTPANFIMPYLISPNNHNTLYAAPDRVYRSLDGGATWTALSGPLHPNDCDNGTTTSCPMSALAVSSGADTSLYAGDNSGHVYYSHDGGATWTGGFVIGSTGQTVTGLAVDPNNEQTVYATFAGFNTGSTRGKHVMVSSDGGITWGDVSATLPNIPFEAIVVNPLDGSLIAGSDTGVWHSTNSGIAWSRYGTGLPNVPINQVFTNQDGTELYVATHGRGMWTLPLPLNLYAGDDDSNVYSVHAASGLLRWRVATTGKPQSTPVLMSAQVGGTPTSLLYIGATNDGLYALRTADGSQVWKHPNNPGYEAFPAQPAAQAGVVYDAFADGAYAMDAATGNPIWTFSPGAETGVGGGPTLGDSTVYLPAGGPALYAVSKLSGTQNWVVNRPGSNFPGPVTEVNSVAYTEGWYLDNHYYALDSSSGNQIWSQTPIGFGYSNFPPAVTVVNGVVYAGAQYGEIYALKASDGSVVWNTYLGAAPNSAPAVVNGRVYFITQYGTVYAVQAADGSIVWNQPLGGFANSAVPAVRVIGGVVYTSTGSGASVVALNAVTGAVQWTRPLPSTIEGGVAVGP